MEDLYTYDSGNYSDYMGGSSFDSPLSSLDESAMTILAVMGIIALVIFILQIVAKWKIFTKADEHGWAALIPFYNTYVLYKITWENGLFFLLSYIPCLWPPYSARATDLPSGCLSSVLSFIPSSALTAPNTTVRSTTTDPFQTKNDSHYELLERNLLLC